MSLLALLHLCDSLFPIGSYVHSDGLEAAVAMTQADAARLLDEWIDASLDETFRRLEGPVVWRVCAAYRAADWDRIAAIDRELLTLRPCSAARESTRALGMRLLTTWSALHPSSDLSHAIDLVHEGRLTPTLPVAFGLSCAGSGIDGRDATEAYGYTRVSAATSAAMRLMAIGQTEAHRALARALGRLPAIVDGIARSSAPLECFTPMMDIAAMAQPRLHSRLFRS